MDAKGAVKKMLFNSRLSQAKLAVLLKKSQGTVSTYVERDVRVGTLAKIAAVTDHEIILRDKRTSATWVIDGVGDDE